MPVWSEAYDEAARRCFADGKTLLQAQCYPNASHLFGLAAECALKTAMKNVPGADRELPKKHLPDLKDDAKRWLSGKRHVGLKSLLNMTDYMPGWSIDNRYWPGRAFTPAQCEIHRDHARRTLIAASGGGRL